MPQQARGSIKGRAPQTDLELGARCFQGAQRYADDLSNLCWTRSTLNEVDDLSDILWRELRSPLVHRRLGVLVRGFHRWFSPAMIVPTIHNLVKTYKHANGGLWRRGGANAPKYSQQIVKKLISLLT